MSITHTSKDTRDNPRGIVGLGMVIGRGAAIEFQEKNGLRELVHSELIPRKHATDAQLIAIGFRLGAMVADDKLFRQATLPTGWKKRASDHSMWSYIDDDEGRERASIFYKAAFYDRDAFMRLNRRFTIDSPYFEGDDRWACIQCHVLDAGVSVFSSKVYRHANPTHANIDAAGSKEADAAYWSENTTFQECAKTECEAWLKDNGYPDYSNPALYW